MDAHGRSLLQRRVLVSGGGASPGGTRAEEVLWGLLATVGGLLLSCLLVALLLWSCRLLGLTRRAGPAALTLAFALWCVLAYPLFWGDDHGRGARCQSNVKQLELHMMYLQDDTAAPPDRPAKEGLGEGSRAAPEAGTAKPPAGEAGGGVQ